MADVQITLIRKPDRLSRHDGITHLGNIHGMWTVEQVIAWIESGMNTFFTQVNGVRANIGVVNGQYRKHVQTYADGVWTDNLLALQEG